MVGSKPTPLAQCFQKPILNVISVCVCVYTFIYLYILKMCVYVSTAGRWLTGREFESSWSKPTLSVGIHQR